MGYGYYGSDVSDFIKNTEEYKNYVEAHNDYNLNLKSKFIETMKKTDFNYETNLEFQEMAQNVLDKINNAEKELSEKYPDWKYNSDKYSFEEFINSDEYKEKQKIIKQLSDLNETDLPTEEELEDIANRLYNSDKAIIEKYFPDCDCSNYLELQYGRKGIQNV